MGYEWRGAFVARRPAIVTPTRIADTLNRPSMLSASAYSFRQKSRLAISLSWVAGYTNVITFIACAVVTSHATGNVTHFGKALADYLGGAAGATREALYFGGLVVAFFFGAVVSGCMT